MFFYIFQLYIICWFPIGSTLGASVIILEVNWRLENTNIRKRVKNADYHVASFYAGFLNLIAVTFWRNALSVIIVKNLSEIKKERYYQFFKSLSFILLSLCLLFLLVFGFFQIDIWTIIFLAILIILFSICILNKINHRDTFDIKIFNSRLLNYVIVDVFIPYIFIFIWIRILISIMI